MRKVPAERGVVCRTKRRLLAGKSLAVKSLHPAAAYSLRVIFIFYTPPVCSKNTGGLFMSKYKFKLDARTMALMSLLTACEIVLSRFCSVNTHGVKLGFSFIPAALCGIILGPVPAGIVCALSDFLGAMLFPFGPYHPGFTLTAFAMGFTYGFFLYELHEYSGKQIFLRVFAVSLINSLVFGLLVNTLWVSQLYGSKTYFGWFVFRLTTEYAIQIPLRTLVIPLFVPLARRLFTMYRKAN